jgi:CheY-like chemotaxis protein
MNSTPKLIRILSVDDHPLLRKGIAALVNAEPDMKLIAESSNGQEAVDSFRLHRPDVTLMDIQMPGFNGIEAIDCILSEFPDAQIIVLTTYTGDVQVLRISGVFFFVRHARREWSQGVLGVRALSICTPGRRHFRPFRFFCNYLTCRRRGYISATTVLEFR